MKGIEVASGAVLPGAGFGTFLLKELGHFGATNRTEGSRNRELYTAGHRGQGFSDHDQGVRENM